MNYLDWNRFPCTAAHPSARSWLIIQTNLGLSLNTIQAYARALEDYFAFSARIGVDESHSLRTHIAAYVNDLCHRPSLKQGLPGTNAKRHFGLANATIQLRITAVRLYYDYLVEEGLCQINPVGRGCYVTGKAFGGRRERGLIPHYRHLPWIPSDEEWKAILEVARGSRCTIA